MTGTKVCGGCGKRKRLSSFYTNGYKAGKVRYKPKCKVCVRRENKRVRRENRAVINARKRARYHERMASEPGYAERLREQAREAKREAAKDPARRERMRAQAREWKRRQRERDSALVNDLQRIDYALRRERRGLTTRPRADHTGGRAPVYADRFRLWLDAYSLASGLATAGEIAEEIGVGEWLVQRVWLQGQERVEYDVVDRAILLAPRAVEVGGVAVWSIADLYPESIADLTAEADWWRGGDDEAEAA